MFLLTDRAHVNTGIVVRCLLLGEMSAMVCIPAGSEISTAEVRCQKASTRERVLGRASVDH